MVSRIDSQRFAMDGYVTRLLYYLDVCPCLQFAQTMAPNLVMDMEAAEQLFGSLSEPEIAEAVRIRTGLEGGRETSTTQTAHQLWADVQGRLQTNPLNDFHERLLSVFQKHHIHDAQVAFSTGGVRDSGSNGGMYLQTVAFGSAKKDTWFEMASLSKSVATAFALQYFANKGVSVTTSVDELLSQTKSTFR